MSRPLFTVVPVIHCANTACTNKVSDGRFTVVRLVQLSLIMCGQCADVLEGLIVEKGIES